MKKVSKIILIIFLGFSIFLGLAFISKKSELAEWEITNSNKNQSEISWAKFNWVNKFINGKYFEKVAINLPCKIENLPYTFTFQLDLGADRTGIYENNLSSFYKSNPELLNNVKRLKNPIQFWNSKKSYNNLNLSFGDYIAKNNKSYLYNNYGEKINLESIKKNDTIHIGTIGVDLFKNKVLIIDYPNQRIAICEKIPAEFTKNLIDIELDRNGRVILPYKSNSEKYKVMFDTGSSMFPLIATSKKIERFSKQPIIDTIETSSTGTKHYMTSRIINKTFELGGMKFINQKIYENRTNKGIDLEPDATAGNYLFWKNVVVIDFRNKKFGIN